MASNRKAKGRRRSFPWRATEFNEQTFHNGSVQETIRFSVRWLQRMDWLSKIFACCLRDLLRLTYRALIILSYYY